MFIMESYFLTTTPNPFEKLIIMPKNSPIFSLVSIKESFSPCSESNFSTNSATINSCVCASVKSSMCINIAIYFFVNILFWAQGTCKLIISLFALSILAISCTITTHNLKQCVLPYYNSCVNFICRYPSSVIISILTCQITLATCNL